MSPYHGCANMYCHLIILGAWLFLAGCDSQSPVEPPAPPVDPCENLQFTAPVEPDAPLTGKILFSSRRKGMWQLYSMRPDGSDQRQLTFLKDHFADMGRWSPDGEQIVFISDSLGSTAGSPLYLMDADGGNIRPLKILSMTGDTPYLQSGFWPAWSPDGTRIAFTHCLNCEAGGLNYEVLVYDFLSGKVNDLTNNIAGDQDPSWSPDGSRIAFVSNRETFYQLYIMDSNGANIRRRTFEERNATAPVWSPDGAWIAFSLRGELRVYHVECEVVIPISVSVPNDNLIPVVWSPDGGRLLAISRSLHLYLVDVACNEITRLLADDEVFFADWSRE